MHTACVDRARECSFDSLHSQCIAFYLFVHVRHHTQSDDLKQVKLVKISRISQRSLSILTSQARRSGWSWSPALDKTAMRLECREPKEHSLVLSKTNRKWIKNNAPRVLYWFSIIHCFLFVLPCTTSHAERQPQAGQAREDLKIFTEKFVNSYITGAAERVELIPCAR